MKDRMGVVIVVGKSFKMWLAIIIPFPYSRQTSNAKWTKSQYIGRTEVVDVRRNPPAVVELKEVIAGFMISADKDRETRCNSLATVVFVEIRHPPIFCRHCGHIKVMLVSHSLGLSVLGLKGIVFSLLPYLKVAADDENISI